MEEAILILTILSIIVFFTSLVILGFKDKVMHIKSTPSNVWLHRNPVPPRNMLNKFGKVVHTIFHISGALMIVFGMMGFYLAVK